MNDLDSINWVESQNAFSDTSKNIFVRGIRYEFSKGHTIYKTILGRFRYFIDGELSKTTPQKQLNNDNAENECRAYYWHYHLFGCCLDNTLNYENIPELKSERFMLKKINSGKWNFNLGIYDCITRTIADIKTNLDSNQSLIIYFPLNKNIDKEAQRKYISGFTGLLKYDKITFVVGDINKIKNEEKQLVVIIIDIVSTTKRKNYIINDIRNKKSTLKPIVTMISLFLIFDDILGQYCIELEDIKKKKEEEKKAKKLEEEKNAKQKSFNYELDIDEEELIMKSLAGHGPDPEMFGF